MVQNHPFILINNLNFDHLTNTNSFINKLLVAGDFTIVQLAKKLSSVEDVIKEFQKSRKRSMFSQKTEDKVIW